MSFYSIARGLVKGLSYVICPIRVHGDISSIPDDSGIIISANHLSYFDVIFLGVACKRQIHFVAKKKYAKMFLLKHLVKWLGAFGIDTDKPDLGALRKCFKVIKDKEVLGIFPEGTRVRGGKISDPMPGVAMIAHKTHAPIFYIRIKPRTKNGLFRVFCKTDLYIGGVVTVEELGITDGKGTQYKDASVALLDKIYSLGEK